MAENPATWGPAEHVVAKALDEAAEAFLQHVCGLSTVRRVTDALREAGLLAEFCPGGVKYEQQHRFHEDGSQCWHREKEPQASQQARDAHNIAVARSAPRPPGC